MTANQGRGWPGDGPLTRRAMLHLLVKAGGAAAVLGARAKGHGANHRAADRGTKNGPTGPGRGDVLPGPAALPQLGSVATKASSQGAQAFKSRPDLQPPVITVDVPQSAAAGPGLVLTDCHAGPAQQGPLIIDGSGELVWFLPLSPGADTALRAFNFQAQTLNGKTVLAWFQGAVVLAHGQGHYELWDTNYAKIAEVQAHNGYQADLHEFVLTPQGTALFTCYGQSSANLAKFGGKQEGAYFYGVVQEVDVRTGALLFEWRSDQHVGLAESYVKVTSATVPWDYFHINSIAVDPTDGNLIISGRNAWAFYKVDRSTGKVLWRAGGKSSDFKVGPGAHFAFQHDVRRYADGSVTMFDNEGGPPAEAPSSRGLVLAMDENGRSISLAHQYDHSPPIMSDALGSVQDLGQGQHFVGWGESSYFSQYDSSGRVVFDAHLTHGTESYRAFKQPWQGNPIEPPAIAVVSGTGAATVYASWNGATSVAQWSVLGGADAKHLSALGRARRAGFETTITVPHPPPYLAVEALDSSGRALGRSSAHRLA
jgi:Arylsulfotransferase (ASST)